MNLLNGIMDVVFGPDTRAMSEEDRKKTESARAADRGTAAKDAFAVQNDQGESFIDGSEAVRAGDSGSDILKSLAKVFKLFA